jgi:hypothetical protein
MADLYPLVAALVIAAGVYVLRERHRRRTRIQPARPDLSIQEAWDWWRARSPYRATDEVLEEARKSLAEPDGLDSVRKQMMRDVTTTLYLETILELEEPERKALLKGYEEGMEPLLLRLTGVSSVRWRVLREYGRLKYDDAAREDWFEQYVDVAAPYIREKVRLARAFLLEFDQGASRLVEIYDHLLCELETRLLTSPRKKRYAPPDLSKSHASTHL